MEIDLNKQLIPYMEHVINQTLNMVDKIFVDTDNIDRVEISRLLTQLNDEFKDYIILLSPQTQGRLMEINHHILGNDKIYEMKDNQLNIQSFDNNAKE
jgi:hypothetical protein